MQARALLLLIAFVSSHALAADAFSCRSLAPHRDVVVRETTLAGVPAIVRVPAKITKAPIVLWHGFGPPASEAALMDALPLDDVPAIKVYLGLPLFGKRAEAGGVDALKRRQEADVALQVFEPVVAGAAKELPSVMEALRNDGCARAGERIGLFGFSAGGAAVLYALAERDVPIGSAVVLNASTGLSASIAAYERAIGKPYAWSDAARDLAKRTDATGRAKDIASRHPALLIVQGTKDTLLTPELTTSLHGALAPLYTGADKAREQLMLLDGLSHNITDEAGIEDLRRRIGGWFDRWLDRS
ncbi:MAG TPA: prolyl oligopeptidase family serine peptidase [Rhodanobacteraceae bacterium]|nr:prolyl oligopeptidase family serine peptidase [Rhodanobacteraceae bacterium]